MGFRGKATFFLKDNQWKITSDVVVLFFKAYQEKYECRKAECIVNALPDEDTN